MVTKLMTITKSKFLVIAALLVLIQGNPTMASDQGDTTDQVMPETRYEVQSGKLDKRAKILADYFALHNSPLQYQAQDFIDAADTYDVDWKLVPAISGVESTFGKFTPGGYNAYGWGIFTSDSRFGFKSYRDGIFTVTAGLKKNYIDKGLKDPYAMNKVYAASPYWGGKVNFFMDQIDQFAQNHPLNQIPDTKAQSSLLSKTAATSGIIDLNQ